MRIGILAYHSACNYGANLQVLSTVGYLTKNGHVPLVLNYEPEDLKIYYKIKTSSKVYKAYEMFRNQVMPLTRYCNSTIDLAHVIDEENLDGVIIGSDAVAQHHSLLERVVFPSRHVISIRKVTSDRLFPNPFWGTFLSYLNRKIPIAILSSSSQDSVYKYYSKSIKNSMYECLRNFSYISVRDVWTKKMYENISLGQLNVDVTPDPVFSFNQNCPNLLMSREEVIGKFGLRDRYILLSFLDAKTVSPEWLTIFEKLVAEKGIQCVALPFPQNVCFHNPISKKIESPLLPLDWYSLIKYSVGYVGHNMHPIVVALHNAVPFFSFDNYGVVKYRGIYSDEKTSKIFDILNRADLQENRSSCITYGYTPPSPDFVLEHIFNFDRDKCRSFSAKYYDLYNNTMEKILNLFKENLK